MSRCQLCERQIGVLKENVRIWCNTEHTKDWVRLLPVISLMMNSQESLATGYTPSNLPLTESRAGNAAAVSFVWSQDL